MIVKAPIFSLPPQTSYFETLILNGFFFPQMGKDSCTLLGGQGDKTY